MALTAQPGTFVRGLIAYSLVACSLLVLPGRGRACGATPPSLTLLTSGGRIFAGTRVLTLYAYGGQPHPVQVVLRSEGQADLPLAVAAPEAPEESAIRIDLPAGVLASGSRYTLEIDELVQDGASSARKTLAFEVVDAPAEPGKLGMLEVESAGHGAIAYGGCGGSWPGVQVVVVLQPDGWSSDWVQGAEHQLWVDGERTSTLHMVDYLARPLGLHVRVLAQCDGDSAEALFGSGQVLSGPSDAHDLQLPPGRHQLMWTSVFPSGRTLSSAPLDVDLRCIKELAEEPGATVGFVNPNTGACSAAPAGRETSQRSALSLWLLGAALLTRRVARRRSQSTTARTQP